MAVHVFVGGTAVVSWNPKEPGAASATVAVTRPDGVAVDPAPTVSGSGPFTAEFTPTLPGRHTLLWTSGDMVQPDILDVWTATPRYLISIDDAARAVMSDPSRMSQDLRDQLQLDLAAATVIIEDMTGPLLVTSKTVTRDGGRQSVSLPHWGVSDVTVTIDGTLWSSDSYVVDAEAGIVHFKVIPPTDWQNVVIAYSVGDAEISPNHRLACMEQVRFLWQTRRQGHGREAQQLGYTPSGYAVPYMVQGLCAPSTPAPGFA